MSSTISKIETFFTGIFTSRVFEHEVVATITAKISDQLTDFKQQMDNVLNTDI